LKLTATSAPWWAIPRAMPRPMLRDPPVTRARWPSRRMRTPRVQSTWASAGKKSGASDEHATVGQLVPASNAVSLVRSCP